MTVIRVELSKELNSYSNPLGLVNTLTLTPGFIGMNHSLVHMVAPKEGLAD